jgi:hypothetical protein
VGVVVSGSLPPPPPLGGESGPTAHDCPLPEKAGVCGGLWRCQDGHFATCGAASRRNIGAAMVTWLGLGLGLGSGSGSGSGLGLGLGLGAAMATSSHSLLLHVTVLVRRSAPASNELSPKPAKWPVVVRMAIVSVRRAAHAQSLASQAAGVAARAVGPLRSRGGYPRRAHSTRCPSRCPAQCVRVPCRPARRATGLQP